MARPALERVPIDAVDVGATRRQFEPMAVLTLGNAATPTDGFDGMFAEAADHADQHQNFGATLDPDLRDANFVPGQIAEATLGPTAREYESFTGAGGSILGAVNPPTPPTAPGSSANESGGTREDAPEFHSFGQATVGGRRAAYLDPYDDFAVGGFDSPV